MIGLSVGIVPLTLLDTAAKNSGYVVENYTVGPLGFHRPFKLSILMRFPFDNLHKDHNNTCVVCAKIHKLRDWQ